MLLPTPKDGRHSLLMRGLPILVFFFAPEEERIEDKEEELDDEAADMPLCFSTLLCLQILLSLATVATC